MLHSPHGKRAQSHTGWQERPGRAADFNRDALAYLAERVTGEAGLGHVQFVAQPRSLVGASLPSHYEPLYESPRHDYLPTPRPVA